MQKGKLDTARGGNTDNTNQLISELEAMATTGGGATALDGGAKSISADDLPIMRYPPHKIKVIQMRANEYLNEKNVLGMVETLTTGGRLPVITTYRDKKTTADILLSGNGAHRIEAYLRAKMDAEVIIIDVEDAERAAFLDALGANAENTGVRNDRDLRKVFEHILADEELSGKSLQEMAKIAKVSRQTATKHIRKIKLETDDSSPVRKRDSEVDKTANALIGSLREGCEKLSEIPNWYPSEADVEHLKALIADLVKIKNSANDVPVPPADEIKQFMERHKLDNTKMGLLIGVDKNTIRRWVAGEFKGIKQPNVKKLRAVLNLKPAQVNEMLTLAEESARKDAPEVKDE